MNRLILVLVALALTACGPFVAGTWSDDPKNWKRAFAEDHPNDGIEIVHSWYMRSSHFTAEFAWFFELNLTERAKNELIGNPGLERLSHFSAEDFRSRIYREIPGWFRLDPLSDYDAYESTLDRDFLIFVEKSGGRSYWTRYQM